MESRPGTWILACINHSSICQPVWHFRSHVTCQYFQRWFCIEAKVKIVKSPICGGSHYKGFFSPENEVMLWCIKTKAKSQHNSNPAYGSTLNLTCESIYIKVLAMHIWDHLTCLDKLITQTWMKKRAYAIVLNDKLFFREAERAVADYVLGSVSQRKQGSWAPAQFWVSKFPQIRMIQM